MSQAQKASMRPATGRLPSVLIVDDEALVRSFVRDALVPRALVKEASDAEKALAILEEHAWGIDLVLLDHSLPRLSGLRALQIMKRNWPWIPIVLITAFGSEELAAQALRAGASDYLPKPIGLAALLQTVARLVRLEGRIALPEASAVVATCLVNGTQPVHPNVRRALVFINEHFAEKITLADVAREAGLSRFHFCRLFHREIGVPFHDHLHDVRLRRAKTLLTDRYLRISEIAYSVGFNDLSHFDRTFRKVVGCSPSEFRASLECA
jgi:YesN/AraC family two-component response regulator